MASKYDKKKPREQDEFGNYRLSKSTQALLDLLVADSASLLPAEERVFKVKNRAHYIWNLFNAQLPKYKYSSAEYHELFEYLACYSETPVEELTGSN